MWSIILLMSRLPEVIACLRAGDRKSSAIPTVDCRQSNAGRHYQAIGADRTQRSAIVWVGDRCKRAETPAQVGG